MEDGAKVQEMHCASVAMNVSITENERDSKRRISPQPDDYALNTIFMQAHLLTKNQTVSIRMLNDVRIRLQEGEGDVAVDLGLDGNLHLEIEVQTKLQSFLGCDGALVGASDELTTGNGGSFGRGEFGSGFGGRHVSAVDPCSGRSFYGL